MKDQFLTDIRVSQTSLNCVDEAIFVVHIINETTVSHSKSNCTTCTSMGNVCQHGQLQNIPSHIPYFKPWSLCLERHTQSIKIAV